MPGLFQVFFQKHLPTQHLFYTIFFYLLEIQPLHVVAGSLLYIQGQAFILKDKRMAQQKDRFIVNNSMQQTG